MYSEPCKIFKMEPFAKIRLLAVNYFVKNSISNVWLGSEKASDYLQCLQCWNVEENVTALFISNSRQIKSGVPWVETSSLNLVNITNDNSRPTFTSDSLGLLEAATERRSLNTVFLKIVQSSQENICVRVSFRIKLQAGGIVVVCSYLS